ncbi:secreted protein [marine sediment metagenome]|uniref:Secreted protein n=1 Tax=marine sediment metagenome TaxID=412755 RepID=A0A1B6NQ13_9ZZZZ
MLSCAYTRPVTALVLARLISSAAMGSVLSFSISDIMACCACSKLTPSRAVA